MNARTRLPLPCDTILACRRDLQGEALRLTRPHRDLLSMEEVRAIADLATAEAAKCWDPTRRVPFVAYARSWVRGAVLKALAHEQRQRRVDECAARVLVARPASRIDDQASARELLSLLGTYDCRFLVAHHFDEVPLTRLAVRARHHPSWACRRHARLRTTLSRLRAVHCTGGAPL
jgi:hypothetical protein